MKLTLVFKTILPEFTLLGTGEAVFGRNNGDYNSDKTKVCFDSYTNYVQGLPQSYPLYIANEKVGLKQVKAIRKELKKNYISLDEINGVIIGCGGENFLLDLDEQGAQSIPHFQETCEVDVIVSFLALNKFVSVSLEHWCPMKKEKRAVYSYVNRVDLKALMKEWKEAGYPLKWEVRPATAVTG
jgi:hypothetical protein